MASRVLPGVGLRGFDTYKAHNWNEWADVNWLTISSLLQGRVLSAITALPGSPADGDIYIVPSSASSHANEIAIRDNGDWFYLVPQSGWRFYVIDSGTMIQYDGTDWVSNKSVVLDESASSNSPVIEMRKKGSGSGASAATPSAAIIGRSDFYGWTGSAFRLGAKMLVRAAELWSGTVGGTEMAFQVVTAGSAALVERLLLTADALLPAATDLTMSLGSLTTRWTKGWFGNISLFPASSVTPATNGEVTFELTSNTILTVKVKGSDGTVRSGTVTLS